MKSLDWLENPILTGLFLVFLVFAMRYFLLMAFKKINFTGGTQFLGG